MWRSLVQPFHGYICHGNAAGKAEQFLKSALRKQEQLLQMQLDRRMMQVMQPDLRIFRSQVSYLIAYPAHAASAALQRPARDFCSAHSCRIRAFCFNPIIRRGRHAFAQRQGRLFHLVPAVANKREPPQELCPTHETTLLSLSSEGI